MKSLKNIVFAVFTGTIGSAYAEEAQPKIVERDVPSMTCTDDGNGRFSFHLEGYDEPIVQILKSRYGFDHNHAVLVHTPQTQPEIYTTPLEERPDIKLSDAFKHNFENFNGRFLMFYEESEEGEKLCSIEDWLPSTNTIVRNFVKRVEAPSLSK